VDTELPSPTVSDPVRITRAIEFSSSLRIVLPDASAEESRAAFGARAERHGHNYRLEVTLEGPPDPITGMVLDLKELKDVLEREVMARFDHRDLVEDTPFFEKTPATPENFAAVLHGLLADALPDGLLAGLRLYVDGDTWVDAGGASG